jgi:hypothetical protein
MFAFETPKYEPLLINGTAFGEIEKRTNEHDFGKGLKKI